MGFLSSLTDAVSGIGDVFVGVHHDREQGDRSYRRALTASLKSTGNMGASYAAGTTVGSAVILGGTAVLGTVTAPAWLTALGVAGGIGGAYYAGRKYQQFVDWLF